MWLTVLTAVLVVFNILLEQINGNNTSLLFTNPKHSIPARIIAKRIVAGPGAGIAIALEGLLIGTFIE